MNFYIYKLFMRYIQSLRKLVRLVHAAYIPYIEYAKWMQDVWTWTYASSCRSFWIANDNQQIHLHKTWDDKMKILIPNSNFVCRWVLNLSKIMLFFWMIKGWVIMLKKFTLNPIDHFCRFNDRIQFSFSLILHNAKSRFDRGFEL